MIDINIVSLRYYSSSGIIQRLSDINNNNDNNNKNNNNNNFRSLLSLQLYTKMSLMSVKDD